MRVTARWSSALPAGAVLVLLVGIDIVTHGPTVSLAPLFALAPLMACAVLPTGSTAAFGALAVLAAVASGFWNGTPATAQQAVRLVDVALISAAAVLVAVVRLRREHQLGRVTKIAEIAQRAVLPILPAHARRVDIAVRYQSAAEDAVIGGDLYDCYHSRSHTRFLLGDVRGKGIGAVEQAARVIRAFRQAAAIQSDLATVADDMSAYLSPFFDEEEFVTAVLLDTTDATQPVLVNAGHPWPLLIHPDGRCEFVQVDADLPLGLGDRYASHSFEWRPGDRLVIYTDGLSESRNADGTFFDLAGVAPLLVGKPLETALDDLLQALHAHAAHGELGDDVAVLLLEHATTEQEYVPIVGEHDWRMSLAR